jgi:hypothetical protein
MQMQAQSIRDICPGDRAQSPRSNSCAGTGSICAPMPPTCGRRARRPAAQHGRRHRPHHLVLGSSCLRLTGSRGKSCWLTTAGNRGRGHHDWSRGVPVDSVSPFPELPASRQSAASSHPGLMVATTRGFHLYFARVTGASPEDYCVSAQWLCREACAAGGCRHASAEAA